MAVSLGGRVVADRLNLPTASKGVQLDNRAFWNDSRSPEDADFFTFGYSGRTTDEIMDALKEAKVSTVVDIRFSPFSRYKPDFSRRNLERIVKSHELNYLHLRRLGVPREIRAKAAEAADLNVIWDWYDEAVVRSFAGRNLDTFFNMADHPVALMCTEMDPRACHRHLLFQALEDRGLHGFDL